MRRLIKKPVNFIGAGAWTGYGKGKKALWEGLCSGLPAATESDQNGQWASRVDVPSPVSPIMGMDYAIKTTVAEAFDDAEARGWRPPRNPERIGIITASTLGNTRAWEEFDENPESFGKKQYLAAHISTTIADVTRKRRIHGPSKVVQAMCATGNLALLDAKAWIDDDLVDTVLVVVFDLSSTKRHIDAFVGLGAAFDDQSPLEGCLPFQDGSRGFSAGEAVVAFLLTNKRGGRPWATLRGGAMLSEAHHPVSIHPSGEYAIKTVERALKWANVRPDEVDCYNAHGPGTQQCTDVETKILGRIFRNRRGLRVVSTKPQHGHCQSAAAAVEVLVVLMMIELEFIPAPRIRGKNPHELLVDGLTHAWINVVVKASFGMGGHDSAIAITRPGWKPPRLRRAFRSLRAA